MNDTIVGMHQPNILPWIGYFYKIYQSNVFILVDDIQFIKSGSSYTNSFSINERGKSIKLTIPIKRIKGVTQNINEIYPIDLQWKRKYKKRIELAYCKCPYYKEEKDFIFNLLSSPITNQSEYNIHIIKEIAKKLNIKTKIKISSLMENTPVSNPTERIIQLAKLVNATSYISGRGGDNYQEHKLFKENNIKLTYSNFIDFEYPQHKTQKFVKGLSIIDAIFNIGFKNLQKKFEEMHYENSKPNI